MPNQAAALPPLPQLLAAGGDERLTIDPTSGRNRYGCPILPDPELVVLSSSTASPISEQGLQTAEALYQNFRQSLQHGESADRLYARHAGRIADELRQICRIDDIPNLAVQLTPSGTDAHRLAARRTMLSTTAPLLALAIAAEETGSGVPDALGESARLETVPLREADARWRNPADIDADFIRRAEHAIQRGLHLLLVIADVSKTGLVAPSVSVADALRARWPGRCTVLVDACQFRLPAATLHRHLDAGFMVAITGSKFFGGPCFSGALLIPEAQTEAQTLPAPHPGLLLRWQAALAEMRLFHTLPDTGIVDFIHEFSLKVASRVDQSPACRTLPMAQQPQTGILSFHLRQPATSIPLTAEQTRQVHLLLQTDLRTLVGDHAASSSRQRFLLGQPVCCGRHRDTRLSALRICISSRMIAEALASPKARQHVIERAFAAIEKIEHIINLHLDQATPCKF